MINIEILPLEGIVIENVGKINLDISKTEILKLLGQPSEFSNKKQLFFSDYELRIDFDNNDKVEFIEFIFGPFPEKTKLSIYNIDPFQIGAEKLVDILTEKNNGKIDDSEADFSYGFLDISVGIWRDMTEKDAEETIQEMKAEKTYEENKNWLEEDLEKSKNYWTIGIGRKNYYD
jgi:hypothetical protein